MSLITKKAMVNSFKNLLTQKHFDKITIQDIADDCGINRMTFYYHFKDIYDLAQWALEEDAHRLLEGKKEYETWQEGMLQILQEVHDNKSFILNIYHHVSKEHIETYLYNVTTDLLLGVINEVAKDFSISEEDCHLILAFYKYAFVGLVLDWIKGGMKEEPQMIVDKISKLLQGQFLLAIKNLSIS